MLSKMERRLQSGLWKSKRKEWGNFYDQTRFEVGNKRIVNFWQDMWHGGITLKDSFPSLYNLVASMEAQVKDVGKIDGGMAIRNASQGILMTQDGYL